MSYGCVVLDEKLGQVHAFCTVVLHLSWQDVSKLFDLGHAIVGTDTNHKKTDV